MSYSLGDQAQQPISVLLVEDDRTFVKIVQYHLKKYQGKEFKLTWKESTEDAITEIQNNSSFDIILTDYIFPTSNGLEFCLQLNQMGSSIPIVFLTQSGDVKLAVEAMKLGVEDFLLKEDLDASQLPRIILNVIERASTRKQKLAVENKIAITQNRSQAIQDLVVTVCHEFNNPLAAVKICSELIQRQPISEEEKALMKKFDASLQKIESEIKRLRDITFEKINFHDVEFEKNATEQA